MQGIEARFPEVPLRGVFIDDQLSPSARSALAKFLRVTEHEIKALELRHQFPILPMEWILRSMIGSWSPASICTGESDVWILSDLYPGNEPQNSDGMDPR